MQGCGVEVELVVSKLFDVVLPILAEELLGDEVSDSVR